MILHTKILDKTQKIVLSNIGPFTMANDFVLVGGTAIALRLGHRRSEDFDFFRQTSFDSVKLLSDLQQQFEYKSSQVSIGTLKGSLLGVKVEFLQHGFPTLKTGDILPEYSVYVASLEDLSAMKLMAVSHRSTKKDFMDIYTLAMRFKPLKDLLNFYKAKYDSADIGHVIRSLTHFSPADKNPNPQMVLKVSWEKVKVNITKWVSLLT